MIAALQCIGGCGDYLPVGYRNEFGQIACACGNHTIVPVKITEEEAFRHSIPIKDNK